jgi:hypothetical protein
VQSAGIPGIERSKPIPRENWTNVSGWSILFGGKSEKETEHLLVELEQTLERVGNTLKGII